MKWKWNRKFYEKAHLHVEIDKHVKRSAHTFAVNNDLSLGKVTELALSYWLEAKR